MSFLIQGWLFGIAYVAPIGMQNMYVINTAIQKSRSRAIQVALITIFFDISLALACFFGVGALIESVQILKMIILGAGSVAVIAIGITLMRSKVEEEKEVDLDKPILEIIASCFVVTWLNPQALIDGTLLLAGFRATLTEYGSMFFIAGVCMASIMWFMGLAVIVSFFKKAFNHQRIRMINIVCGAIILLFGIKLAVLFIKMF